MKYAQIKAVLFDHDGTLVDSEQVHYELWCKTLAVDANIYTPKLFAENQVGMPTRDNASFLIDYFDLGESVDSLVTRKAQITQQFLNESYFPAIGDVVGIMQALKKMGLRMAIVSGSERYAVDRSVEGNGFSDYIEFITTGEEVPRNKPCPDVYIRAMEKMEFSPSDCIAVEDTEHGLMAATQAGIECIAIPNEHTRHLKFKHSAEKLDSLQAFLDYFIAHRN